MVEYYHYTTERALTEIIKTGMFSNHPLYTTNQYYTASQAGQAVGVMPHNIDCVLRFDDDGLFRPFNQSTVPETNRFTGGASQFQHPFRPKPTAWRKIGDRKWQRLMQ